MKSLYKTFGFFFTFLPTFFNTFSTSPFFGFRKNIFLFDFSFFNNIFSLFLRSCF